MKQSAIILLSCLFLLPLMGCVKELKQMPVADREFVEKNYPAEGETNNLAFAYAEPDLVINANISEELRNGLYERMKYTGRRVTCHLNDELYKIILAKGFNITERYRNVRYMTFSEKRNTTALFYPEIKLRINERSQIEKKGAGNEFATNGTLEIDATVNIVMMEPLSKEIIWIKSIPVEEVSNSFQYDNAFWAGSYGERMFLNTQFFKVGRGQKGHVPENLVEIAQTIDRVLEEIDSKIVEATLRFVEADEFTFLDTDIKKLKKLNRY